MYRPSSKDLRAVIVVVEELPHDLVIESFDPVMSQNFASLGLRSTRSVVSSTPDGGPNGHEAVLELACSEIKDTPMNANKRSQVAALTQPVVTNDVIIVDVLLIVGLDVVAITFVARRHHRANVFSISSSLVTI